MVHAFSLIDICRLVEIRISGRVESWMEVADLLIEQEECEVKVLWCLNSVVAVL